ncbi:ABC transporter ATP-binding protein [Cellulosimicrobium sp. 22601]|uniref:ABC transporter ATP-binding protein n=1 Tax=unclassified Cellulosimicrobium TaxID=2624466 RepID=UPI003F830832
MIAAACRAIGLCARAAPGTLAVFATITLIEGLLPAGLALTIKWLLDVLQSGSDAPGVPPSLADSPLTIVLLVVVIGLLGALTGSALGYLGDRVRRAVSLLVTQRLYGAVSALPGLRSLEDPAFRDRIRMAETAATSAPQEIVYSLFGAMRSVLTLASLLGILVTISPLVTALTIAASIPALFVALVLNRERATALWMISPRMRRQAFYQELMLNTAAAAEVRIFGARSFLVNRMRGELSAINAEEERLDRKNVLSEAPLSLLAASVSGGGLVWMVLAAARGEFTIGDVSAFIAAVAGVQGSTRMLVQSVTRSHETLLMLRHYDDLLATPPDLTAPAEPAALNPLSGEIRFEDVWFRYTPDGPWVLRGVSFSVPAGSSLAIVGLNGAGKSTLVKLLCRLYDPVRGRILWDGTDVTAFDVDDLRSRISVVFQDFMSYELTVRENVALGSLDGLRDDDRIGAALSAAGADGLVDGLPRGYETMLSRLFYNDEEVVDGVPETGTTLSGGQWQRLALARSLMRRSRDLLILDEPTSGLDPQAEREVRDLLDTLREGTATVLVSHRLGAARNADQIVVLEGGCVAERGCHDELVALDGEYARLFALQAADYTEVLA